MNNKNISTKKTTHAKLLRVFLILTILSFIVVLGFIIIKTTGLWEKINSIQKLKSIVESGGVFSFIIFILLQILQTTILQIPAIFVTLAGTLIFGKWTAFILSYIAVVFGSTIMFWIGRKVGRKFLNWLIGEEESEKWIKKLSDGKYIFFLMMLFPMFPDDILCVVAGVTNMSFGFFMTTNLISRSIGIASTVFLGSGTIIPFHGWGLIVWGVIVLMVAFLFYFSIKYKEKIDGIIKQFTNKKKKKR